jgi:hypothetical protein
MKITRWLSGALIAGILGVAACSKKAPPPPQYLEISGVKIELPKLQEVFNAGTPEQKANIANISSSIRYGQYAQGLMSLDKVSADPNLTEPQKQTVAAVMEQLKTVLSKSPQ